MRKKVASGILAAVTAVTSTVVGMMWPTLDPAYGTPILVACGVLFLVAIGIWFWPGRNDDSGGVTQATSGPQSHNIGHARDVHIHNHPTPAERQDRKSPYGGWNDTNLAALDRIMRGPNELTKGLHKGLGIERPKPDMTLTELLTRVYKHLGPIPSEAPKRAEAQRKVDLEIMDAIVENRMHVWGRFMDRAREPLHPASLAKGKLDHLAGTFSVLNAGAVRPMAFKDLTFNRAEVDQVWPKK